MGTKNILDAIVQCVSIFLNVVVVMFSEVTKISDKGYILNRGLC